MVFFPKNPEMCIIPSENTGIRIVKKNKAFVAFAPHFLANSAETYEKETP